MMWLLWIIFVVMGLGVDDLPYDEPFTVTLDGESPALLIFTGNAGQTVTITANRADDDNPLNDPVLVVVRNGFVLAYNHRHGTDSPELAPEDAQIRDFLLPADGDYTLYVNTYGGIYAGDVTVTLTRFDAFFTTVEETDQRVTITGILPPGRAYEGYTFYVQAGEVITLTARDAGRTLDPVLTLLDADGQVITWNDDHAGHDLTLDAFDAQIWRFEVPADDVYTVRLSDFLGQSGAFMLTIDVLTGQDG